MATRPTRSQARLFAQLIADLTPEVHRAFMASVTDLQSHVNWARLLSSLTDGDISGAVAALNISPAAWNEYSSAMSNAYAAAGAASSAQIVLSGTGGIGIRFNMSNPRAERWIREHVADRVVGFTSEAIQVARALIEAGYAQGAHPRTIALDLVGRTTGPGGTRVGGALGLDAPRAERLMRVTEGMRTTEGVQSLVTRHLDGTLSVKYKVNTATANRIFKAYRNETAVPEADRIISERQYKNALLKHRADTVAETETANAVMSARDESWEQLVEDEGIDPNSVIKTWRHRRGDSRYHRPDHLAMSGREVRGLNTPFEFPDGAQLRYAHDPDAGPEHIIRCGCDTEYRISHSVGLS